MIGLYSALIGTKSLTHIDAVFPLQHIDKSVCSRLKLPISSNMLGNIACVHIISYNTQCLDLDQCTALYYEEKDFLPSLTTKEWICVISNTNDLWVDALRKICRNNFKWCISIVIEILTWEISVHILIMHRLHR